MSARVALSPVLVLLSGCHPPAAEPTDTGSPAPEAQQWWQFGHDEILDSVILHYLGQAWSQSSDVAEVLETAGRVEDPTTWTAEWVRSAERIGDDARESEAGGHLRSAAQSWLRVATYYRAALHRHYDPSSTEVVDLAQLEVEAFARYLDLSGSPCIDVAIPYEDTTLPAYFCRAAVEGPAPVVLFHEGKDGWAEDGKFVADEANARGWHALLFDGPGMGKTLRLQGLPFRPDWEEVVTPVLDWLVEQDGVDASRLALYGVSFGGYFAPEAATVEHRLAALVANPGLVDVSAIYEGYIDAIDPGLLALLDQDEAAFDQAIEQVMDASEVLRWGLADSMWHFGADSPADLMREVQRYDFTGREGDVTTPTLVVDAEAEAWGQSARLYDALRCEKDTVLFTAEEAAQFHVQTGATAIHVQKVFDWLEGLL